MQLEKRLYILIDKQLETVYGCVQGGHAVAQWLLENKNQSWDNQYLIYLSADIHKWMTRLDYMGLQYSVFREPDLNNVPTAIAIEHNGSIFKILKKMGL